jgi:predicted site-specific integrase-resolvase
MKAEEAAELIGVSSGFLRRLAREGYIARPYTAATVREGYAAYETDKEARAVAREEARGDDIEIAIERERLRLADLRHQLASHRRAKIAHVAEAWAWVFGEVRADTSAVWSKAGDRIAGRAEWCAARDRVEGMLNPINVVFNAVELSDPFRAPPQVVDRYGAPDPAWPLKKQKQWARLRDLAFRADRWEAASRDVEEVAADLNAKCRRFRSLLRQLTGNLADYLNVGYNARTTNEIVQEAVGWVEDRVATRKNEAVAALRAGTDPGDLDYE